MTDGAEAPPGARRAADRWGTALFVLSLLVFLASRLVGLSDFPIYFFGDEAVQSVQAENLLQNHGKDPENHQLLPTYFRNGTAFNIGASVYAQIPGYLLFGHTIATTRAVGVLFGLLAAAAVGLILRDAFGLRFWWTGVLLLGITPAWFLHSRTAFEVVLGVACYAWFLYFYLRYRRGNGPALLAAVVAAALAFYAYNAIQPVVAATALLLLLADAPYHARRWRWVLLALAVAALGAVPYARYLAVRPGETARRLQEINSTWVRRDLTTRQKLEAFGDRYRIAISPAYWYARESERDVLRHRMKGWGHVWWPTLPFAAVGLALCAWRIREPGPRAVLVALAAAPLGAAVASVLVTRGMAVVVPAALLTGVGLDAALRGLARLVPGRAVAVAAFAVLAGAQAAMTADALRHGARWYDDYGLYGMQWGAKQVFGELVLRHRAAPARPIVLSPVWANGADDLAQFFVGRGTVRFAGMSAVAADPASALPDALYVFPEDEYRLIAEDPKLRIDIEKTIDDPGGHPAFRFASIAPAPNWRELLAAEVEQRHRLATEEVPVRGETWTVAHSILDMGPLSNLFDGEPSTLVRTKEVDPAVFEFTFSKPRPVRAVSVTTETGTIALTLTRTSPDGSKDERSRTWQGLPPDPTVSLEFADSRPAKKLRLVVENVDKKEPTHLHIREIRVEP